MIDQHSLFSRWAAACFIAAIVILPVQAQITSTRQALDAALKHEAIASAGDKMKLYSLYANYNGAIKRWSFQFYDGGANIHNISVTKSGKARHYTRDKGRAHIFDDLDWSTLPAPTEVLIDDIAEQAKSALAALKFDVVDNGRLYMNYYVRNEIRQKHKAYHAWSVTLPLKEKNKGKTVGFKNGKLETIVNAPISGR